MTPPVGRQLQRLSVLEAINLFRKAVWTFVSDRLSFFSLHATGKQDKRHSQAAFIRQ